MNSQETVNGSRRPMVQNCWDALCKDHGKEAQTVQFGH